MKEFKNILFVIIGSFIASYGAVAFLSPNNMVTGGGVGIAQLLYSITNFLTLGSWIAIVAIPLMIIGWIYFGKGYVLKTIFITPPINNVNYAIIMHGKDRWKKTNTKRAVR